MVSNITSLTNHGLRDWLVQRVTAVLIGAYALGLGLFFLWHPDLDYYTWRALFHSTAMRVISAVIFLSVLLHGWVGLWTVTTDYLKCACLRVFAQMFIFISLLSLFLWAVLVLWSL